MLRGREPAKFAAEKEKIAAHTEMFREETLKFKAHRDMFKEESEKIDAQKRIFKVETDKIKVYILGTTVRFLDTGGILIVILLVCHWNLVHLLSDIFPCSHKP